MKRTTLLGALLVAAIVCSLAISTPEPAHAVCCRGDYVTPQGWRMAATCGQAQAAVLADLLPYAQAQCGSMEVCGQFLNAPCYPKDGQIVSDGFLHYGCLDTTTTCGGGGGGLDPNYPD